MWLLGGIVIEDLGARTDGYEVGILTQRLQLRHRHVSIDKLHSGEGRESFNSHTKTL